MRKIVAGIGKYSFFFFLALSQNSWTKIVGMVLLDIESSAFSSILVAN